MQPHFLFNALNTVSSLMYSDLKAADSAISRLAELLRASLELNEKNETSLEQEIHMLHAYAELMSLRFVERVEISWQIDTAVLHHRVPVMSLQTILENTFKHTIEKSSGLTHIAIDCRLQENDLILLIQDDKGRLTNSPGGIGIKNLRQRLQAIYGEGAALQIQQVQPAGVATRVRIPQVTQSTHSDAQ
jgi:LytS/YehU family sensor histidine kinase